MRRLHLAIYLSGFSAGVGLALFGLYIVAKEVDLALPSGVRLAIGLVGLAALFASFALNQAVQGRIARRGPSP